MHVDLLRVRMDEAIQTTVVLELTGADEAPGVGEGGVLEPGDPRGQHRGAAGDIPDVDHHTTCPGMEINDTLLLVGIHRPRGVRSSTTPRRPSSPPHAAALEPVEEEIETETELVGEDGEPIEAPRAKTAPKGEAARVGRLLGRVLKVFSSAPVDWLIVGLGNPGPGYAEHPHNVGFEVGRGARAPLGPAQGEEEVRRRARRGPHRRRAGPRGRAAAADVHERGRPLRRPGARRLQLTLDRVLVVHDEIDLPFGEIRPRLGGGLAGHNGLKSLKRELGGADFPRVRVGVGRPTRPTPTSSPPTCSAGCASRAAEVRELVDRAADEAERIVLGG